MNGAELKTLREACGLSVPDMARLAVSPRTGESVGERTVRYWEAGSVPIPDDVAATIGKMDADFSTIANQALDAWREAVQTSGHPEAVYLVRYRENEDLWRFWPTMKGMPATCHGALINRARLLLVAAGAQVRIVWMEPGEYSQWLNGRKDSELLRSMWAAEQDQVNGQPGS